MLNQLKQLSAKNDVVIIVGYSGTGKTYNVAQLVKANAESGQMNIIITRSNNSINYAKHVSTEQTSIRFVPLRMLTLMEFPDNTHLVVLTADSESGCDSKLYGKTIQCLEELSQSLVRKSQTAMLILDDCQLGLQATILDYLKIYGLPNMKVIITCNSLEDLVDGDKFPHIELVK